MFHTIDPIYYDQWFIYHIIYIYKSWIKNNSFIKVEIYSYITLNVTKRSSQTKQQLLIKKVK